MALCGYGWRVWLKRDRRGHRIIRITNSSKKDITKQLLLFFAVFLLLYLLQVLLNKNAAISGFAIVSAFVCATILTGTWLITNKKIEGCYWWLLSCIVAIPLFYAAHYLLYSFALLFLFGAISWCLYKWKKRPIKK